MTRRLFIATLLVIAWVVLCPPDGAMRLRAQSPAPAVAPATATGLPAILPLRDQAAV